MRHWPRTGTRFERAFGSNSGIRVVRAWASEMGTCTIDCSSLPYIWQRPAAGVCRHPGAVGRLAETQILRVPAFACGKLDVHHVEVSFLAALGAHAAECDV